MLTSLTIKNILLLEDITIDFTPGFVVVTGETGAGKSMFFGALLLVLGFKTPAGLIKNHEDHAMVAAHFNIENNDKIKAILTEQDIEAEGELIIRRICYNNGKNKIFINDVPVTLKILNLITENLVEVHGQHDQRGLLDSALHVHLLDKFAKNDQLLAALKQKYENYKNYSKEIELKQAMLDSAAREEDYLSFVLKELEQFNPKPGEEASLFEVRTAYLNNQKSGANVKKALELLNNAGVTQLLAKVSNILAENNSSHNSENKIADTGNFAEIIDNAAMEVGNVIEEMQAVLDAKNIGADEIEQIEERLFALRAMAKKYKVTADELPNFLKDTQEKYYAIKNQEQIQQDLAQKLGQAKIEYLKIARELSAARLKAATVFEDAVLAELKYLKMQNTGFKVTISSSEAETDFKNHGIDEVKFLARTNPGSAFAALNKIASGGELSRFMLALKVVLGDVDKVPLLIFDEVDTGIGGAVAEAVGNRLKILGQKLQVIAITHQVQVAAKGDMHLKLVKIVDTKLNKTHSEILVLDHGGRRSELARMLSGEVVTEAALQVASSLQG